MVVLLQSPKIAHLWNALEEVGGGLNNPETPTAFSLPPAGWNMRLFCTLGATHTTHTHTWTFIHTHIHAHTDNGTMVMSSLRYLPSQYSLVCHSCYRSINIVIASLELTDFVCLEGGVEGILIATKPHPPHNQLAKKKWKEAGFCSIPNIFCTGNTR